MDKEALNRSILEFVGLANRKKAILQDQMQKVNSSIRSVNSLKKRGITSTHIDEACQTIELNIQESRSEELAGEIEEINEEEEQKLLAIRKAGRD
ncbi:hypothetical protein HOD38_05600 [archaeon]|nr:hypothetical protein [archaeon]MBT4397716.1 hypothetical protein [archaeon]MBT4441588.1 hypothetical protein [archaeon]